MRGDQQRDISSNLSTGTTAHRKVAPERTASSPPLSSPPLKFSLRTLKALVDLLKTLEACHVDTSTGESSARPQP